MVTISRRTVDLTDEQIDSLLARAASDSGAASVGFHPPQPPDPYYRFSQNGTGAFLGGHSAGDGVSHAYFREAVDKLLHTRGNHGSSRAAVTAYWDIVRNAPEAWTSATALTLCQLAPLQGVLAEQAREWENSSDGG